MTDLAAQIIAALDRAEETAQAATPGPWVARTTGVRGGDHWYICDSGQSIAHISANDGVDEEQRPLDAAHVAANDPAHVLRLTTALREVVKLAYEHAETIDGEWGCCHDADAIRTGIVKAAGDWEDDGPLPTDCLGPDAAAPFLAALASVWDVPGDNT